MHSLGLPVSDTTVRLGIIFWHAASQGIQQSKKELPIRVALGCRFIGPLRRLNIVLLDAPPKEVQRPKMTLRIRIPLVCLRAQALHL